MIVIVLRGIVKGIFWLLLLAAALEDWKSRIIDNRIPLFLFLLGIPAFLLFPEQGIPARLLGIFAVAGPMLLLNIIVPGGFGGGDIKLMAASGWLLGWQTVCRAVIPALLTAGIYVLFMLASGKLKRRDTFPLGPFLVLGLAVAVFQS